MIRASGLPSAGDPRIGGGRRGGSSIGNSGRGGIAWQRSASFPTTTKTRATSSSRSDDDDDVGKEKKKKIVIGLGSCGLDYLALVAAFPKPDDKLRTEKLEVRTISD